MRKHSSETWRDVKGYVGYYKVSDLGRVKSLERRVPMRDGRMYTVGEKILTPAKQGTYRHVTLCKSGCEEVCLVHRLVLEAFVGPRPKGMEACHRNGNAADNRVTNLRWGTVESNKDDQRRHGTTALGVRHNSHKLKGRQQEVINLYATGNYTYAELGRMIGVQADTISRLVNGLSYSYLERGY